MGEPPSRMCGGIRCAGAAIGAPFASAPCRTASNPATMGSGGGPVKLSERHGPIPEETPAGPATAVSRSPARTIKNDDGLKAGNQAVARLLTQPKLSVSQPHDAYERQADQVADGIVDGDALRPAPAISRLVTPSADAGEPPELPPGLERTIAAPGPGRPIPDDVRARIEAYLGVPLRNVQVHDDRRAQLAAAQLGARA